MIVGECAVTSVVQGALTVEHVVKNVAAISAKIPADFWAALKEERLIPAQAPVPA